MIEVNCVISARFMIYAVYLRRNARGRIAGREREGKNKGMEYSRFNDPMPPNIISAPLPWIPDGLVLVSLRW